MSKRTPLRYLDEEGTKVLVSEIIKGFPKCLEQKESLPTPSADELGKIYQYIGATTATLNNGGIYQCRLVGTAYLWVEVVSSGGDVLVDDLTIEKNALNKLQLKEGGIESKHLESNFKNYVLSREKVFRYNVMPTITTELITTIAQFVGTTAGGYVTGRFYKPKRVGDHYEWDEIPVQAAKDIEINQFKAGVVDTTALTNDDNHMATSRLIKATIDEAGHQITMSLNGSTYVLTVTLNDKHGSVLSSAHVSLPLSSLILNIRYIDTTEHPKSLEIELANGTKIYVPLTDIVSGLVNQTRKVGGNALDHDITNEELFNSIRLVEGEERNKTINADYNTISNLEADNIKNGVIDTTSLTLDDIHWPSSKLVGQLISEASGGIIDGDFNSTTSKLHVFLKSSGGTVLSEVFITLPFNNIVYLNEAQTLTNKTINAANNTISGITKTNFLVSSYTSLPENDYDKFLLAKGLYDNLLDNTRTVFTVFQEDNESKVKLQLFNNNNVAVVNKTFSFNSIVLTEANVVNDLTHTATNLPLSAGQGKLLKDQIGDLTALKTTEKTNLSGAINEVYDEVKEAQKGIKFVGFISSTEPATAKIGDYWYESDAQGMPVSLPYPVRTKTLTGWSATITSYTPQPLEMWANLNNSHEYYWSGGAWNIIDSSGDVSVDNITINKNVAEQIQVKDGGLTKAKTSAEFWTDNSLTGITNAENVTITGDLTADDGAIDDLVVNTSITIPAPTTDMNAATKKYVDDRVTISATGTSTTPAKYITVGTNEYKISADSITVIPTRSAATGSGWYFIQDEGVLEAYIA